MSSHHLAKGSPLPEVKPDLLRVYSMRFCPYAERTRLVLAYKNIPHEIVNINLKNKPEWLFERNPFGLVPTIEYQGHYIYESAVCDEFLEEKFPDSTLLPSGAFERAAARLFMTLSDKKTAVLAGFYKANTPEDRQKELDNWKESLQYFENHLTSTNKPFFGGAQVGLADFHIWPFFARVPAFGAIHGLDLLPAESFPRVAAWYKAMENVDAVRKSRSPVELLKKYLESVRAGETRYEFEEAA